MSDHHIIDTSEYASNSKIKREPTEPDRKKLDKVIQGESITKKKSIGRKFSDTFIKEDFGSVKNYVVTEVIIPSVIDLISEALHNTIDMMFRGEGSGRRYSSYSGHNKTNYGSVYKNLSKNNNPTQSYRSVVRDRSDIDDIILESRGDAEEVLSCMHDILDDYKMVSVADLYDLIGRSTIFTQNNIGWYDLNGARIERVREGFLLKMPRPVNLT